MDFTIVQLRSDEATLESLTSLLIETVAHGGSVSFMHPLSEADARAFWDNALQAAGKGERIIFCAMADGQVLGTVTLLLDCPPNQPHRAEIAKMMTRLAHRGQGIARALLAAAETEAMVRGRWLLVLDTASDEGASGLYEKADYVYAGEIPDYALKPHGGLTGTRLYWKRLN